MFDTSSIPQNLILNIPIFVIFQQEVPFVFIELKSEVYVEYSHFSYGLIDFMCQDCRYE